MTLATLLRQNDTKVATDELHDRVERLVPNVMAHVTLKLIAEQTGLLQKSDDDRWMFSATLFHEFFLASSWVAALSGRLSSFVEELRRPVSNAKSAMVRFMGFMSSDASETIDRVLRSTKPSELETAVNLTEVLSQRIEISSSTLSGYTNLVLAALSHEFEGKTLPTAERSADRAEEPRITLRVVDEGNQLIQLALF